MLDAEFWYELRLLMGELLGREISSNESMADNLRELRLKLVAEREIEEARLEANRIANDREFRREIYGDFPTGLVRRNDA